VTSRILLAASRHESRWANGAGTTTEVAVFPADASFADFDWRISVATIDRDGPFSLIPGVERLLVPLGAAGLMLEIDGRLERIERAAVIKFGGESLVFAVGVAHSSFDLNLMCRRGRAQGSVEVVAVCGSWESSPTVGTRVAIFLTGKIAVLGCQLAYLDAVTSEGPGPIFATGTGELAVFDIVNVGQSSSKP
jgi:environmental stress-induced protein Ves